jgi:adenosine deaminase
MTMLRLRLLHILLCMSGAAAGAHTQAVPVHQAVRTANANEARTIKAFGEARAHGQLALYAFLYGMPKGGDLHNHLYGAVYAESWIRDAAQDHLCVDVKTLSFVHSGGRASGVDALRCDPPGDGTIVAAVDASGHFPAAALGGNQPLYDALVDAFSMRSFVATSGDSGHDHFFASFDKFDGPSHAHMPEWLDEVAARAASQNEQYLELMHTPPFADAAKLAINTGYTSDFASDRQKMLDGGLKSEIAPIRSEMDGYQKSQRAMEHCDTPQAAPACQVKVRFIYQVLRNFPPPVVFAQILLGFEVAAADPQHFLAINLVQPEDDFYAMRDYHLHMQMIAALRRFYPGVHVTLHAGELAPGLVPPDGLLFHIRDAVETAGAERIGHGVDVMNEERPYELLHELADRHVMVEINLTSNEGILNVGGPTSPLPYYIDAGVPVALSTDDEGVNRSNMTHEYAKAATLYGLSYPQLKNMARNSLSYSFLSGESLWPIASVASMYREPAAACRSSVARLANDPRVSADAACMKFLAASEKAAAQWEMERRFTAFEAGH